MTANKNNMKLDFFPAEYLAAPRLLVQSAVFISGRRRSAPVDGNVAVWGNVVMSMTGSSLNQFDFEVWAAILKSMMTNSSIELSTSRRELCRSLGFSTGQAQLKRIENSVTRLFNTTLKISKEGSEPKIFSLLQEFEGPKSALNIALAPSMVRLMQNKILVYNFKFEGLKPTAKKLYFLLSSMGDGQKRLILSSKLQKDTTKPGLIDIFGSKLSQKEFNRQIRLALKQLEFTGCIEPDWEFTHRHINFMIRPVSL